ncbi:MAG: hypothetical protein ACM3ML_09790 [Micromonosporaceae bacterium]
MTEEDLNGGDTVSGAANEIKSPQDAATDRFWPGIRFYVWLYGVVGIPFVILAAIDGWGNAFRSGDASAFMCGAIVASFAESVIEQVDIFVTHLKAYPKNRYQSKERTLKAFHSFIMEPDSLYRLTMVVFVIGFLIWNGYFAVADKTVHHSSVDWVQIVVFLVTVFALPIFRGFEPPGAD